MIYGLTKYDKFCEYDFQQDSNGRWVTFTEINFIRILLHSAKIIHQNRAKEVIHQISLENISQLVLN